MKKRKLNEDEVISSLRKKQDCKVDSSKRIVYILEGYVYPKSKTLLSNDLGNGSWGKIDFLVNHLHYQKIYVEKFPRNIY